MSAHNRSVPSRSHSSLVAIALLGLLLVFLSSVTYQQASAAPVGHGFTGPMNHLVVASHHETLRASAEKPDTDTDDEGLADIPDGWLGHSVDTFTPTTDGATYAVTTVYPARHTRFLTPLLRAPPLI